MGCVSPEDQLKKEKSSAQPFIGIMRNGWKNPPLERKRSHKSEDKHLKEARIKDEL